MERTGKDARGPTALDIRWGRSEEEHVTERRCGVVAHGAKRQSQFGAPHRRVLCRLRKDLVTDSHLRVLRSRTRKICTVVMSVILAIYGFIDLILLLAANVVNERVQPMLYALASAKKCERVLQAENETEGTGQKEKSNMRRTKINGKGQITIPADLRERFGIRKGTRIDWTRDGGRLVLTPINLPRKKSKVSTQST